MIKTLPYDHTLCGEGISIVATLGDPATLVPVGGDPLGYDPSTRVFTADTDDVVPWVANSPYTYALSAEL